MKSVAAADRRRTKGNCPRIRAHGFTAKKIKRPKKQPFGAILRPVLDAAASGLNPAHTLPGSRSSSSWSGVVASRSRAAETRRSELTDAARSAESSRSRHPGYACATAHSVVVEKVALVHKTGVIAG